MGGLITQETFLKMIKELDKDGDGQVSKVRPDANSGAPTAGACLHCKLAGLAVLGLAARRSAGGRRARPPRTPRPATSPPRFRQAQQLPAELLRRRRVAPPWPCLAHRAEPRACASAG